jgi:hypothetical protein
VHLPPNSEFVLNGFDAHGQPVDRGSDLI